MPLPPPHPADLTSGSLIESLIQSAAALATSSIPAEQLTTITPALLEAVANSIASLNAIVVSSTSVADIQKVGASGVALGWLG